MKYVGLIFTALITLMYATCGTGTLASNSANISFSYPEPVSRTGQGGEAKDIFICNVNEKTFRHMPLEQGINTFTVDKSGIHLIALTSVPGTGSARGSRDISSAVSLIGNIEIVSLGLDTLPVSEAGQDEIYLGEVEAQGDKVTSDIFGSEASELLGYTEGTLEDFAGFDNLTLKLANPDINENGIYDSDEEIEWEFNVIYYFDFPLSPAEYDADTISIAPDEILSASAGLSYIFSSHSLLDPWDLTVDDLDNLRLIFPEDIEIHADSGERVTDVTPHWADEWDIQVSPFEGRADWSLEPLPPWNGDYAVKIFNTYYPINNASFMKPADDFENFTFPIFKQLTDEEGNVVSVTWKWKIVKNGGYETPTSTQVGMRIHNLEIGWEVIGGDPAIDEPVSIIPENFAEGGTVYPEGINVNERRLRMYFFDIAGNNYYWMQH